MLKKSLISYISNRKGKAKSHPETCGFSKAETIGILVNGAIPEPDNLAAFINNFETADKTTHVLGVNSSKTSLLTSIKSMVSHDDFTVLGKPKTETALAFFKRQYDYLILLDQKGDTLLKHFAMTCNATYLIGFSNYPENDILTLQVKPAEGNDLEDLFRYIKMIDD